MSDIRILEITTDAGQATISLLDGTTRRSIFCSVAVAGDLSALLELLARDRRDSFQFDVEAWRGCLFATGASANIHGIPQREEHSLQS